MERGVGGLAAGLGRQSAARVEWPTLALVLACYAGWGVATLLLPAISLPLAIVATAITVAFHASLQHEVIHGHPFRSRALNEALVFPALTVWIPFRRFRDTHLDHHLDSILTDPYDDPESNYLDPAVWARLPRSVRAILLFNNTMLGRLIVGPLVGQIAFLIGEIRQAQSKRPAVVAGWLWHVVALVPVAGWILFVAALPLWAYLAATYLALSLLKIRTFLEHQAHERARGRTVIIEDRGPLSWLFLNNNLHVVHHMHPKVPWYRLPQLYYSNRARYLRMNEGYAYPSYAAVIGRYLLRRKDPVAHPLWPET